MQIDPAAPYGHGGQPFAGLVLLEAQQPELLVPPPLMQQHLDSSIDDEMEEDSIDAEIRNLLALKHARRTARTQSRRQLLLQQLAAGMSPVPAAACSSAGGCVEAPAQDFTNSAGLGDTTGAVLQLAGGPGRNGWAAHRAAPSCRNSIDIGALQHHFAALQPSEACSGGLSLLNSSTGADGASHSGLLPVPLLVSELVTPAQSGECLPSSFAAGGQSDAELLATLEQLSISTLRQQQQAQQPCNTSLVMASGGGITPLPLQLQPCTGSALLPAGCVLSPLDQHCFAPGFGLPLAAFASLPSSMPVSPASVLGGRQPPTPAHDHGLPRRAATFNASPSSVPPHMAGTLPARPATGGQSTGMAHMLQTGASSPNLAASACMIIGSPRPAGTDLQVVASGPSFGTLLVAPAAQQLAPAPSPPPSVRRATSASASSGCWLQPGVQAGAGGPPPLKGTGVFLPGITVARRSNAVPHRGNSGHF